MRPHNLLLIDYGGIDDPINRSRFFQERIQTQGIVLEEGANSVIHKMIERNSSGSQLLLEKRAMLPLDHKKARNQIRKNEDEHCNNRENQYEAVEPLFSRLIGGWVNRKVHTFNVFSIVPDNAINRKATSPDILSGQKVLARPLSPEKPQAGRVPSSTVLRKSHRQTLLA
jgi:hypothetical protein